MSRSANMPEVVNPGTALMMRTMRETVISKLACSTVPRSTRESRTGYSPGADQMTLDGPDWTELKEGRTIHYIKSIKQPGDRHPRVVVSLDVQPPRIVTLFFDR